LQLFAQHLQQVLFAGQITATGAIAEQNIETATRLRGEKRIKRHHRGYLAEWYIEFGGGLLYRVRRNIPVLLLDCVQAVQQVVTRE
jgi:hypothetical protein